MELTFTKCSLKDAVQLRLISEQTFVNLIHVMQNFWMRLAVWIGISVTLFHLMSGIRHMAMDLGFWESLPAARISAYAVFALGFIVTVLIGVWVW
mgnify:CR=1 FL=1